MTLIKRDMSPRAFIYTLVEFYSGIFYKLNELRWCHPAHYHIGCLTVKVLGITNPAHKLVNFGGTEARSDCNRFPEFIPEGLQNIEYKLQKVIKGVNIRCITNPVFLRRVGFNKLRDCEIKHNYLPLL